MDVQESVIEFIQTTFQTSDRDTIIEKILNDDSLCFTSNLYKMYEMFCETKDYPLAVYTLFKNVILTEYDLDTQQVHVKLPDKTDSTRLKFCKYLGAQTVHLKKEE